MRKNLQNEEKRKIPCWVESMEKKSQQEHENDNNNNVWNYRFVTDELLLQTSEAFFFLVYLGMDESQVL